MQSESDHARANVLGVPISALTMDQALQTIHRWIVDRERNFVCTVDVHALMESRSAPDLRQVYEQAGLVAADGMPLVWLLRQRGHSVAERVCGPDLMLAVFRVSGQRGYRHFLYGSTEATLARLQLELHRQYPTAMIVGSYSPPFRTPTPEEQTRADRMLNGAGADIVWVGLGAPKQERWMAARRPSLNAPVLIGVGAAFDMIAGNVKRAPPMLRQTGLEWMYRVYQEPKRLARRYLHSNSKFLLLLALERLRPRTEQVGS